MLTFLLVFTMLQTAVKSDFDELTTTCFTIGRAEFLVDCSINPDHSVQLLAAGHVPRRAAFGVGTWTRYSSDLQTRYAYTSCLQVEVSLGVPPHVCYSHAVWQERVVGKGE